MCDFCKIANKEMEAHVVFENENVIVVLDYEPIHEGHTLILPKLHVDSIELLPDDMVKDVISTAQNLVKVLQHLYKAEGYTLMQNGGKFCDYGHAHFHVFPRFENDGFEWVCDQDGEYSEKVAQKMRMELSKISKTK